MSKTDDSINMEQAKVDSRFTELMQKTGELTERESSEVYELTEKARQLDHERYKKLLQEAQAVFKATVGWHTGIETPEDWQKVCKRSLEEYQSGRFLMGCLGAERYLDPNQMATLWLLRQRILEESGVKTAAEMMLVDLAVMSYANALRVQGWIGNLCLIIECESFVQQPPRVKFRNEHGCGPIEGLKLEESLKRIREQILPLFDRTNRAVIRNLKAIRDLRQGPPPIVAIGRADQVNVAQQQANAMMSERESAK